MRWVLGVVRHTMLANLVSRSKGGLLMQETATCCAALSLSLAPSAVHTQSLRTRNKHQSTGPLEQLLILLRAIRRPSRAQA